MNNDCIPDRAGRDTYALGLQMRVNSIKSGTAKVVPREQEPVTQPKEPPLRSHPETVPYETSDHTSKSSTETQTCAALSASTPERKTNQPGCGHRTCAEVP